LVALQRPDQMQFDILVFFEKRRPLAGCLGNPVLAEDTLAGLQQRLDLRTGKRLGDDHQLYRTGFAAGLFLRRGDARAYSIQILKNRHSSSSIKVPVGPPRNSLISYLVAAA